MSSRSRSVFRARQRASQRSSRWSPLAVVILAWICLPVSVAFVTPAAAQEGLRSLARKDTLRLLLTDSGLGGLSVAAQMDSIARRTRAYRHLDVVFCNALPESDYGYNHMTTDAERSEVFRDALEGMVRSYAPDAVFIACNTLSVVYRKEPADIPAWIPVVDIVTLGTERLAAASVEHPDAVMVLLGTPTTIAAGDHKNDLVGRGVPEDRIVVQECGELASEIQLDARSDMVDTMIGLYAGEALSKVSPDARGIIAGLVCTHYGYRSASFAGALSGTGSRQVMMVDPNDAMSSMMFRLAQGRSFDSATVRVRVISRAELTAGEIRSIAGLVRPTSPATAAALEQYERRMDLFQFKRRPEGAIEQQ